MLLLILEKSGNKKDTLFDLNKARNKAHVLIGLVVANDNIDEIIRINKILKGFKRSSRKTS